MAYFFNNQNNITIIQILSCIPKAIHIRKGSFKRQAFFHARKCYFKWIFTLFQLSLLSFYSLFFSQRQPMVFLWSLSDKSPQVLMTLPSILTDLNSAVVSIVSICPLISKSSCPFIKPLVTVPRTPATIGITVTLRFHSFFSSLARSMYLSFFSLSFNFTLWLFETAESTIRQVLFLFFFFFFFFFYLFILFYFIFLLIIIRSGHLAEIR